MAKRKNRDKHTKLSQHKQYKKTLTPPLAALPSLKPSSWMNDRLPEMLWAVLLISELPRSEALETFRRVGDYVSQFADTDESIHDISHTGLSRIKIEALEKLLRFIVVTEEHRKALSPLLLLKELPALETWKLILGTEVFDRDWQKLAHAVALTLDHQSQEATDCRWVRILCMVSSGKAIMPPESVKEIAYYPHYGDMREVRPSIRASEITFSDLFEDGRIWAEKFWSQCLSDTLCFPLPLDAPLNPVIGTTPERVKEVYDFLIQHSFNTRHTTAIDARHDTVIGYGLYVLGILQELLRVGASQTITARLGLRAIVEGLITLAYLAKKDDLELWQSYRVYGAGQAKLSLLKLDEVEEDLSYVNLETLQQLVNEDIWEEFLSIEIGHWANIDTRKMSEVAGVKDVYDRYYGWTSVFAHSHWGAIRDAVFDTCGNPLHRLHRIPRKTVHGLPDVIPDACKCVDKILEIVSNCYPNFPHRVSVKM